MSGRARCIAALVTVWTAAAEAREPPVGDWHGVLSTPAGPLTLLVTIGERPDGSLSGELESVDQAEGEKLPLAKLVASPGALAFSVPAIDATYEGTWNGKAWSGVFRQGMALPLVLEQGAPPPAKIVEGLDGTWRATLQRAQAKLRLVLHVRTSPRGTRVKLDSPDLGVMGLVVEGFERDRDALRFRVPAAEAEFHGTVDGELRTLAGRWSKPGLPDAQIAFERDSPRAPARARTQWPIVPRGYRAEDVSFVNPTDRTVTLAGTLTIPDGPGPFPAAVLISGSGPQDRDETVFGHKPFAVLADHLSRHGVAVLRYDDRGFGASTGDHERATSADLATDANAAVGCLAGRAEIDRSAIGLIGHSEGGIIGPIAAVENPRVAFVVLLAGPGTRTDELLISQRRLLGLAQGLSSQQLESTEAVMRDVLRAVRGSDDSRQAKAQIRALLTTEALGALGATGAQREAIATVFSGPWMRYFIRYRPSWFLSRLRIPVLALGGSADRQVPSAENLAAIAVALVGNRDATVRELPNLNHMFQTASSGSLGEYEELAETFAPDAMDTIGDWILARFGRRRASEPVR